MTGPGIRNLSDTIIIILLYQLIKVVVFICQRLRAGNWFQLSWKQFLPWDVFSDWWSDGSEKDDGGEMSFNFTNIHVFKNVEKQDS